MPGPTIRVQRDKATAQVYSSSCTIGPCKVCVLQVSTKTLQLTQIFLDHKMSEKDVPLFFYLNGTGAMYYRFAVSERGADMTVQNICTTIEECSPQKHINPLELPTGVLCLSFYHMHHLKYNLIIRQVMHMTKVNL